MSINQKVIFAFLKTRNRKFTQTYIAPFLYLSKSQLSKPLACKPEFIYDRIFDLNNKESLLHGEDSADLLGALKLYIEKAGLKQNMEGAWDKGYRNFVMEFLKRALMHLPERKSLSEKKSPINDAPLLTEESKFNELHGTVHKPENKAVPAPSIIDYSFRPEAKELIEQFKSKRNSDVPSRFLKTMQEGLLKPCKDEENKKP